MLFVLFCKLVFLSGKEWCRQWQNIIDRLSRPHIPQGKASGTRACRKRVVDKGKPLERVGRKATGSKLELFTKGADGQPSHGTLSLIIPPAR